MAPLAHAEGYLGPPEGYPTGGHSLPLAPRGEVGDRQRSTSEHRGSCKKSEWGRRDGGSGNTDDPCRPPGGSPAVAADVIQQRCACVVSMALCDRGANTPSASGAAGVGNTTTTPASRFQSPNRSCDRQDSTRGSPLGFYKC